MKLRAGGVATTGSPIAPWLVDILSSGFLVRRVSISRSRDMDAVPAALCYGIGCAGKESGPSVEAPVETLMLPALARFVAREAGIGTEVCMIAPMLGEIFLRDPAQRSSISQAAEVRHRILSRFQAVSGGAVEVIDDASLLPAEALSGLSYHEAQTAVILSLQERFSADLKIGWTRLDDDDPVRPLEEKVFLGLPVRDTSEVFFDTFLLGRMHFLYGPAARTAQGRHSRCCPYTSCRATERVLLRKGQDLQRLLPIPHACMKRKELTRALEMIESLDELSRLVQLVCPGLFSFERGGNFEEVGERLETAERRFSEAEEACYHVASFRDIASLEFTTQARRRKAARIDRALAARERLMGRLTELCDIFSE